MKMNNFFRWGYTGLIAVMLCVVASSCVTSKRCLDKFGSDTTHVVVYDTVTVEIEVPVSGDSLTGEVSYDTVVALLDNRIDTISATSVSGKLKTQLWFDKGSNSLKYKTKQKPDTIYVKKEVPVKVVAPCPPVVVPSLEWYEKLWAQFQFFSAFLVLGFLLVLTIKLILK
jgi:hypothetical protein